MSITHKLNVILLGLIDKIRQLVCNSTERNVLRLARLLAALHRKRYDSSTLVRLVQRTI
jgi:hypothetical protein